MASDGERREIADWLRMSRAYWSGMGYQLYMPGFPKIKVFVGGDTTCPENEGDLLDAFALRLADLIDPTCEAYRDALFYPATDLAPEHEETVFRCGECDEVVSFDESYDPMADLPAYCARCGSRITGIGEPWDE